MTGATNFTVASQSLPQRCDARTKFGQLGHFDIWLLGSGGGFMPDVYDIIISDSIHSDSRKSKFVDWLERNGETNLQTRDIKVMHAKPDLRVF